MQLSLFILLVLSALGIVNTAYLVSHVFNKRPVKCLFFPPEWCHKVQFSRYSRTFGIPNSFMGISLYLFIFIFALMFFVGFVPLWPITVAVTIGFLFSLYFTIIQAFVLKAFCTWCVFSALDFTLLFIIIFFVGV
ncbi:MAG: hypothetical protein A3B74_03555 [Candidatus Kerfeldbacteria bacterium RIFCSPHIGHO2_02_FULL_42_14]|uniref:Vitamin K epoxide reductase domain-containing protein n=1 Tax=Candidatus Kerfeldbacteria bacterium RIFCSPHIGHO2_02_FULL_42_14 TaxID=1798540 RepID=A0A1G2ASD9_9BACT|nr:MAG: hypothetical protein A3B74_03555 [Candidatus Kerfeldbacteria bacterium RIFCSPHIGHO2_02_FULL_42_14]OGY80593.1 MAG: hypothetical protein A3E60_04050 [Candidatus Kerfeldbacteria bacterium RIFCSPHIGHO2_12_FULL_42_13]OGY82517.1 MAG: hypothetical protein A3I91_03715 [Candidatus Kerfeldbacteria bacterium RIFCSPLOWO2_02_FULL_42_19]OGY87561.1 MAG: hypothetical protein A3G01_00885 [Candidatus Kerfeldbacteria bacterium RIFCSPLOWO2_12_FULL_43_9]